MLFEHGLLLIPDIIIHATFNCLRPMQVAQRYIDDLHGKIPSELMNFQSSVMAHIPVTIVDVARTRRAIIRLHRQRKGQE